MSASPAQQIANRANAQFSTGPLTPEGKQKSSLNAFRHGLTGQTVIIPEEEKEIYLNFTRQFFEALKPEGTLERQFAQTASDAQWRLNRIKAREDALFAEGKTFEDSAKAFATLSLYESRHRRGQEKAIAQLKALQNDREAKHKAAMEEAMLLKQFDEMEGRIWNPQTDGFVFSPTEVETQIRRNKRLAAAKTAQTWHFNRKLKHRKAA